jgi:hypothetical protein
LKATSLKANSRALGFLHPLLTPTRANFVMGSTTDKVNTHGVLAVIIKEDMKMDKRADMEYM